MKIINKKSFYSGISLFIIIIISYFIKFSSSEGPNYIVYDSLLGKLVFHNPLILAIYLLISGTLIFIGTKKLNII